MSFEDVIRLRTATRKFSERKIEKEVLDKILEAGRLAPTAKNQQPFKVYVVASDERLAAIDEATSCRYGAPTVLIVCGDKVKAYQNENINTYEMDSCIVATHMMLEATNVGVDNIWIERFDPSILRSKFNIPENLVPVCLIPLGYKTEDCPVNPNHTIRKEITELVEYL